MTGTTTIEPAAGDTGEDQQPQAWTLEDLWPDAVNASGGRLYIGMSGALARMQGERLCGLLTEAGVALDDPRPSVRAAVQAVGRMLAHEDSIEINDEVSAIIDTLKEELLPPSVFALQQLRLSDDERSAVFRAWERLPDDITMREAREGIVRTVNEIRGDHPT